MGLRVAASLLLSLGLAGCASAPPNDLPDASQEQGLALAPALTTLLSDSGAYELEGDDVFEVWVCDVPQDTTDPRYFESGLRLRLEPGMIAATLDRTVPEYWRAVSGGRYTPSFVAGSTHTMTADETANDCVAAAVRGADATSDAVLAVATAEHRPDAVGGFGLPGTLCDTGTDCSVHDTGRAAYVGASDFHPDWGDVPALDLVEHEMGHLLGWPHSGGADRSRYDSALDVMSDSAAPRAVDPARRHAQGTLGINRLESGWLDRSAVAVADPEGDAVSVVLAPAGAGRGTELLVLPIDDEKFLTVEYLPRNGLYDFLPASGLAVTLVDLDTICTESSGEDCEALGRHTALTGSAPFTDLLTAADGRWRGHGWSVAVDSFGSDAVIRVAPGG
jgi:hypothetical protein